jgi:hypothetical protein
MKKILLIFSIILMFTSCGEPNSIVSYVYTELIDTEDVEDPEIIDLLPIILALHDDNNLYLYDETGLKVSYSGSIEPAGNNIISIVDTLYYFDQFGTVTDSQPLIVIPDKILIDGSDI